MPPQVWILMICVSAMIITGAYVFWMIESPRLDRRTRKRK